MGTVTLTSDTTTVDLDYPQFVQNIISKNIETFIFATGDEVLADRGKVSHKLMISGTNTEGGVSVATFPLIFPIVFGSETTDTLINIDEMADAQEIVTVSGMHDTNLNTTYLISDYNYKKKGGEPCTYYWVITLERKGDRLDGF